MSQASLPLPASLAHPQPELCREYRNLVDDLYSSRDSAKIKDTNDQLQRFQKSEYAFALAADLFHAATSPNHAYFAALTVAQKSNLSLKHLDTSTNVWVIRLLLQWFVRCVDDDLPTFVLQRVSSTIVTTFMTTRIQWQNCLKDVFIYVFTRDMTKTLTTENVDLAACIQGVSDIQMAAILTMFITLAEECRRQPHTPATDSLHRRVSTNHGAVVVLLTNLYKRLLSGDVARGSLPCYSEQVLRCHLQWMKLFKVSPTLGSPPTLFTDYLSSVLTLIEHLPDSSTSSYAAVTFKAACELLDTAFKDDKIAVSDVFKDEFSVFLGSRRATMFLQMDDGISYAGDASFNRMVLSYCKRQYQVLFLKPNEQSRVLLEKAHYRPLLDIYARKRRHAMDIAQQVSSCLLHRSLEQDLVMDVVNFWEDFAQDTRDYLLKEEAKNYLLNAVHAFCRASAFRLSAGDDDELDFNDEVENEIREDVRSRARDLLQVCCEEYGLAFFEKVLDSADMAWGWVQNRQHKLDAYAELESPVYFLVELAESLRFASSDDLIDGHEDAALGRLFNSPWFSDMFRQDVEIPSTLQKLAVRITGEFKLYFGFHREELWRVLDLLIEKMRIRDLAAPAAVSLRNLCDGNRSMIAQSGRLETMMKVCSEYFVFPAAQREAKAAIVSSVASVAEAMSRPEETSNAASELLAIIANDHERRMAVAQTTGDESDSLGHVVARDTLSLMVAMGRASQAKDDFDDMTERKFAQLQSKREKYWSSEEATPVRIKIAQLLQIGLEAGHFRSDTITLASSVISAGFRERLPGLFVFPPAVTIDFVNAMPPSPDATLIYLKLLGDLTSSQAATPDHDTITASLTYTLRTVDKLSSPSSDPEVAAACTDVAERALRCLPIAVLSLDEDVLKLLLRFTLSCLEVPEPLPKRAGATFWHTFLQQVENAKVSVVARDKLRHVVEYVGGALMTALLVNFAGAASRNELIKLIEPFRMLVGKYTKSKEWLNESMDNGSGGLASVSAADRKRFVDSVMLLRGGVKTRSAVADFWGKCKGTPATGYV